MNVPVFVANSSSTEFLSVPGVFQVAARGPGLQSSRDFGYI